MKHLANGLLAAGAAVLLVSVAGAAPKPDRALTRAAAALGVEKNAALEFAGTGAWYQFGQAPAPGLAWPRWDVSNYRATLWYDANAARTQLTRIQTVEPGRARPAPVETKSDQFVAGELAWNAATGGANAAPTAQPAAAEERRAEIVSTPQGFVRAALANAARVDKGRGESTVAFTSGKQKFEGTINSAGEVTSVRTWIDNPVLGDTLIETKFSDYQKFGDIRFPKHIARSLGGFPTLDIDVTDVKGVSGGTLSAPAGISAVVPAPEVKVTQLAPGVFYLTGGTHHSVVVEEADHIVVVEGPQSEARALAVIAKAKELAPNKAIRYVVNTHAHFDHSGGLRAFVDEGAIVVTDAANRAFYEQAWSAPRTLNPDRLAKSGKPARFETFTGKHLLAGQNPVEIHSIAGSGHNDAFALVYLPAQRLLIEADAYTPAAPNAPAPTSVNPFSVNLLENVERLKLDVAQIAPLHGRLVALRDLRAAVGRSAAPETPQNAVVDAAIPGVVSAGTSIEFVGGGFDGTEGPLPLADGTLVFTENRIDRVQRIAADGSTTLFSEGNLNPNALALGPDGAIFAAQTARPGIAVIHPADKARTLATSYEGKPFNRPNDLIVDRKGGVWFTDPGAGPAQRPPGAPETSAARPVPAVYHVDEKGAVNLVSNDIARPNGISLSPDEKTLYVANTYGDHVIAYDVGADGAVSRKRDFAKLEGYAPPANGNGPSSSGADGLAVDSAGRLYVASSAGVQVFDARGRALGTIKLPRAPQNLAFAGADRKTLYVVGRGAVWKIRTLAAGPAGRAK